MHLRTTCALVLLISGTAHAQAPQPISSGPEPKQSIFSRRDLPTIGLILIGVAVGTQLDEPLSQRFQSPAFQQNGGLHRTSAAGATMGDPGPLLLTTGLYVTGRIATRPALADVGLHATEAIAISGAITGLLKFATGRARPMVATVSPDEPGPDTDELRPGHGVGGFTSFPSGHTTAAFAAASAITSELKYSHPRAGRIAGPLLYGGATLVGLSRMYDNKHWASDILMGAAIGTFVGRRVVRYQHSHRGNHLDRWLLSTSAMPTRGGIALGWSVAAR